MPLKPIGMANSLRPIRTTIHVDGFQRSRRKSGAMPKEYQCDLAVLAVHEGDATVAHQEERTAYRVIQWAHYPVLTVPKSIHI
ncbi:MAG: hypothetical protein JWO13_3298 [Acidobacteriales bacterium]|nr:hypothetical protein [Terriglobales bacterium]